MDVEGGHHFDHFPHGCRPRLGDRGKMEGDKRRVVDQGMNRCMVDGTRPQAGRRALW